MYVHFLVAHQYQYHRNLRRCDDGNEFDGIIYFGWHGCNMLRKKPKYCIDFMKKTTNNDFLVSLIQNIGKIFGCCRNFVYFCPQ